LWKNRFVRLPEARDGVSLFMDAVDGDSDAIRRLVDPFSAAQSVAVVEALYMAAGSGSWIDVSL